MVGIRDLYQLQAMDTEIDVRLKRVAQINSQLEMNKDLLDARADLQVKVARLHEAEQEQKGAEFDAEAVRARIASHEARMYGGESVPSKELQSITAEITHLKERQSQLEARLLGLMEAVDKERAEVERQQGIVKAAEAVSSAAQAHLLEEKSRIEAEMPQWRARRKDFAATIPASTLRIYEQLRTAKGGLAVAKIDRGTCTGCRIAVSVNLAQRARSGKQFAYCASCSRLLYAT